MPFINFPFCRHPLPGNVPIDFASRVPRNRDSQVVRRVTLRNDLRYCFRERLRRAHVYHFSSKTIIDLSLFTRHGTGRVTVNFANGIADIPREAERDDDIKTKLYTFLSFCIIDVDVILVFNY